MRLERTTLLDDPFDLVVPDGHRLARRTSVALEELADETWIGGTPDGAYARIILHSCRAAGFEPRVALAEPPVRRLAAARLAASFHSAATASMLGVVKETADAFSAGRPLRSR